MIILSIDPGAKSGAALFLNGVLIESWQVKPGGEWAVVAEAVIRAEGEPIIAVREDWSLGGRQQTHKRADGSSYTHTNINMLAGLGRAWGRWESILRHGGIKRVVKVHARTWQSMISGRVLPRADMLKLTTALASLIASRDVGEDEGVAIMLGRHATTRGLHHVHAALTIREGKHLGIDVHAARARVASEKAMKREVKQRRKARKVA
jgi:hypothetical protein